MNFAILQKDIQLFIVDNLRTNIAKLVLKGSSFNTVSIQELANQIIGKQKSEKKLPSWFNIKNIYYPPKLNIEQTSSKITANYKANITIRNFPETVAQIRKKTKIKDGDQYIYFLQLLKTTN